MSPVVVRCVTIGDLDAVASLWRVVFPLYSDPAFPHRDPVASARKKLEHGDGLFWLAEQDARVVGTAMAGYDGHRGWLYSVGVHPEARRAGVGARLVAEAERALVALGCSKINLQVLSGNAAAQGFWRSMGYGQDAVVSFGKRVGS